jgi:hypothetical protein
MKLHRALLDHNSVLLAAIAERRGVELTTPLHRDWIEELATALGDPASMQEAIAWLPPDQRAALDALSAAGGRLPATRFCRDHGEVRRMGPGRMEREKPWRDPQSPAEALYYAGLVFFAFDQLEGQIVEVVLVPDDLQPLLPPVQASAQDLAVMAIPEPQIVQDTGRAFVEDLTTLLAWIETDSPHLQPDRTLHPRDLARINARLMHPQDLAGVRHERQAGRLALLLHLARRLRLADFSGGQLVLHRPATREWLKADPSSQILTLQQAWRDTPDWNDLSQVPSLRLERTGWRNDPLATRANLLKQLARCPADQWIDLASLVAAVKQADPDFQRPPEAYKTWYIRDASSGEYLMSYEHWDRVEGTLIAYLIGRPLHWLAALALGFENQQAPPVAFRLTPGGAFFLGLLDQHPQPPAMPPMTIDDSLTVRALAGGSLYDRFQLSRIAEWQASGEVFVYRLTPALLRRTLNQVIHPEQVLAFLRRIAGNRLPPEAEEKLRGWAGRHGEVRLARAAVLETETAAVMQELHAHPEIGPLLGQSLSPTRTLVAEKNYRQLLALLQRMNYLPAKEKGKRQQ